MLQSMITELDGFNPLQNKILMYCLGSPTASIMKPLCAHVEAKRQEQTNEDENEVTAWRYRESKYRESKRNVNACGIQIRANSFGSILGLYVIEELQTMKEQDPILKQERIQKEKRLLQTLMNIKQLELSQKEKNGTPTGIIMRKYMTNFFDKGYTMLENETMWAKFSFGKICGSNSKSIAHLLQPEVRADLTKALNELKAEYKKARDVGLI
jgi:hypothetical protein